MSSPDPRPVSGVRCPWLGSDPAFELLAQRFRALADPLRLRLVQLLLEQEHSVGELTRLAAASPSNVSRHLHVLADAGVVSRRRAAPQVVYAVADPAVAELCELVCCTLEEQLAQQVALIRART